MERHLDRLSAEWERAEDLVNPCESIGFRAPRVPLCEPEWFETDGLEGCAILNQFDQVCSNRNSQFCIEDDEIEMIKPVRFSSAR